MIRDVNDTEEGRAIADALVILGGYCLHRISVEGTAPFKWVPQDSTRYSERRTPADFVRSAMTKLLRRYQEVLKLASSGMYLQDVGAHNKVMKKGAE